MGKEKKTGVTMVSIVRNQMAHLVTEEEKRLRNENKHEDISENVGQQIVHGGEIPSHSANISDNNSVKQEAEIQQSGRANPVADQLLSSNSRKPLMQPGTMKPIQNMSDNAFDNGMNATVVIEKIIQEKGCFKYGCLVSVNGMPPQHKEVAVATFLDGNWLKQIPEFAYTNNSKKSRELIGAYLNHVVRSFNGYREIVNDKPGWFERDDGVWVYLTPDRSFGDNSVAMHSVYGQRFKVSAGNVGAFQDYMKLMDLTPNSPVSSVIGLYTVTSFLCSFYKRCGVPLKFLLFVHGKRGIFKTQIALVMTQIANRKTAEYQLNSTGAGLEAGFRIYKDAVMLSDDLKPPQSAAEQQALHANLELIVRCFGDGTGRKRNYDFIRSNELEAQQYTAEGGQIITGEYTPEFAESSLARCLFLPLKEFDVDVNLLTAIQNDDEILPRFMVGFLQYAAVNQKQILALISDQCKTYRGLMMSKALSNPRYAEYYAQLKTASDILIKYGRDTQQISDSGAKTLSMRFEGVLQQVIWENSNSLVRESPVARICTAIIYGIESGAYNVVSMEACVEDSQNTIYEDERVYHIPQPLIRKMKCQYDADFGYEAAGFTSSSKYISKILIENGILVPVQEGKTKRAAGKIPLHGNGRFVILNKDLLRQHNIQ